MNNNYLYEYVNDLERVFSVSYNKEYSIDAIQKRVSYSGFFQSIEKSNYPSAPIITDKDLIKSLFPELDISLVDIPIYNQCLWAAEAYLRIQDFSKLTFEAIFLYIPINKMYDYFSIYHEMDFSQIVDEFKRLFAAKSVLSLLLDKYHYSVRELSYMTNIPYDTLISLKQRKRDIKKVNIETVVIIADALHVRVETLAELKN